MYKWIKIISRYTRYVPILTYTTLLQVVCADIVVIMCFYRYASFDDLVSERNNETMMLLHTCKCIVNMYMEYIMNLAVADKPLERDLKKTATEVCR